jgi:hypothetical protein
MKTQAMMEENAKRVYLAMQRPDFEFLKVSDLCFELHGPACVIQLTFERHRPSSFVILLSDPRTNCSPDHGMSLWILRHMRGVSNSPSEQDSLGSIGRMLSAHFSDILNGDFSIVSEYSQIENRIFDAMFRVEALPPEHPTRKKYDDYDIRWLDEVDSE